MPRVAVTGIGVICAIGKNTSEYWSSLKDGRGGIGPIQSIDCSNLRFQNGAEVREFSERDHFDGKQAEFMDRFAQFAVVAAREAVRDSKLEWTSALRESTAVITGSCIGGQATEDRGFVDLYRHGRNRVHPLTIPKSMANAGASHICMEFGINGPGFTVSTACSSAAHALGLGYWMVRSGATPLAIAGGSEAPFSFGILKAWEALRVVSSTTCRPFSRDRNGMILGEGAAILILESFDMARARGAAIYGEIVGFGMSSDADHLTHPSPDGAALAMRKALADANLEAAQVGYINAHGTGTDINDPTEAAAIRMVFGKHTDSIAVSSTKSMHGHALGAAAALEAVAAILALHHGIIPPTINFTTPDPACPLDVVPNRSRPADVGYCLSNSFAFGGLNASLAICRA
jgi:nodulation protein E